MPRPTSSGYRGEIIFGAILGLLVFIGIFGLDVLNIYNLNWIMNKSDDTIQHALGGMFYLSDSWHWPPFLLKNISATTQSVSSIDGIPICAFIFKILYPLFRQGELIQYLGIWGLFNYMMQGIMAAILARQLIPLGIGRIFAIFCIVLSAPFINRFPNHTALGSHWLILWGLWLWFQNASRVTIIQWTLLLSLSLLIHPYLTAMVAALFGARLLQWLKERTNLRTVFYHAGAASAGMIFSLYLLGYFTPDQLSALSPGGYGQYSLNLNALLNPVDHQYSRFLAPMPCRPHQAFEGLMYLGAGLLLLAVIYAANIWKQIVNRQTLDRYYWLIACCFALTLYAITNRITLGQTQLLCFYLPRPVMDLFHIFRGSARFFWPVFYLIILVIIKAASADRRPLRSTFFIGLVCFMQIYDIGFGMAEYRWAKFYLSNESIFVPKLSGEAWEKAAAGKTRIFYRFDSKDFKEISYFALRYQLPITDFYLARRSIKSDKIIEEEWQALTENTFDSKTLYILQASKFAELQNTNPNLAKKFSAIDNWYVL